MKRDHESIFRYVSIFFKFDFDVIIYFIMKGGHGNIWGYG